MVASCSLKRPRKISWHDKFPSTVLEDGIDLCIIPIGGSTYYWNHISPENAVRLANEENCKKMLPIHYATFLLTPPDAVITDLIKALLDALPAGQQRDLVDCLSLRYESLYPDIGVSYIIP